MDSWGSQDILAGFEPADPRSNRGESVHVSSGKTVVRYGNQEKRIIQLSLEEL